MSEIISDYMVGFVSTPTFEEAKKISALLVEKNLAACCTILKGAVSIYKWDGKTTTSEECMILIKTRQNVFSDLIDKVREIHSYNLPEIIGVPMTEGLSGYLGWIDDSTRKDFTQIEI